MNRVVVATAAVVVLCGLMAAPPPRSPRRWPTVMTRVTVVRGP